MFIHWLQGLTPIPYFWWED